MAEGVIAVDGIPANGTRSAPVTVTESLTGHAGFSLTAAACQLNSYPAADTGTPTNPQSIAQIQRNQDWFCTFNNKSAPSSTATVIHNAAHATVTSVPAGTTVHDQATVTGQAGLPTPTGTVTFSWFTNGTCTGTRGGDVESVHADGRGRGRDGVHADAARAGEFRVPGDLFG